MAFQTIVLYILYMRGLKKGGSKAVLAATLGIAMQPSCMKSISNVSSLQITINLAQFSVWTKQCRAAESPLKVAQPQRRLVLSTSTAQHKHVTAPSARDAAERSSSAGDAEMSVTYQSQAG